MCEIRWLISPAIESSSSSCEHRMIWKYLVVNWHEWRYKDPLPQAPRLVAIHTMIIPQKKQYTSMPTIYHSCVCFLKHNFSSWSTCQIIQSSQNKTLPLKWWWVSRILGIRLLRLPAKKYDRLVNASRSITSLSVIHPLLFLYVLLLVPGFRVVVAGTNESTLMLVHIPHKTKKFGQ